MSNAGGLPPEGANGDTTYLQQTLRHAPTDLLLDDSAGRELVRSAWRRSVKLAAGGFFFVFLIGLMNRLTSSGGDGGASFVRALLASIVLFILYWVVFRAKEHQEAISEWYTLLAGRAEAADSVYSHIVGTLRDRKMPIQDRIVKRTLTEFGTRGNRLVLVQGYYYVYVTVFSYGTSLYLGWAMWRVRKGRDLLRENNSSPSSGLDPIGRILQLEQLKAMREAVHAVCREALHIAVNEIHVAESYGFPSGMPPIEGLPYKKAPRPGGGRGWTPPPPSP